MNLPPRCPRGKFRLDRYVKGETSGKGWVGAINQGNRRGGSTTELVHPGDPCFGHCRINPRSPVSGPLRNSAPNLLLDIAPKAGHIIIEDVLR